MTASESGDLPWQRTSWWPDRRMHRSCHTVCACASPECSCQSWPCCADPHDVQSTWRSASSSTNNWSAWACSGECDSRTWSRASEHRRWWSSGTCSTTRRTPPWWPSEPGSTIWTPVWLCSAANWSGWTTRIWTEWLDSCRTRIVMFWCVARWSCSFGGKSNGLGSSSTFREHGSIVFWSPCRRTQRRRQSIAWPGCWRRQTLFPKVWAWLCWSTPVRSGTRAPPTRTCSIRWCTGEGWTERTRLQVSTYQKHYKQEQIHTGNLPVPMDDVWKTA